MRRCLLLCCCAVALSASDRALAVAPTSPSEPPPKPARLQHGSIEVERNYHLRDVADWHFASGRYREALNAYSRHQAFGRCGNGVFGSVDHRTSRIALCHAHLRQHFVAAYVCFDGAQNWMGYHATAHFLIQLYREAGQLNDLPGVMVGRCEPRFVGYLLREEQRGAIPPWPEGVPKPPKGSLPKALPR